ncbi:retrovirus-related Pol polyprotein from transposon 412 [Trichonephila inaurata madagascariensis]|uniref:Retrovirus-related Pol polyprotein from transposon 412 n=1 Tax=Trichonephila inaurata madagascariensis TaxID=2747483 RepID=A0A8X6YUC3_9ARAC|nr:retrovirus-related Pol polyprotein from transposon 412 [Trichonephila inaurata madagascariensis]
MRLADDQQSTFLVRKATVPITIGGRTFQIYLVFLPHAKGDRTLLGVDFLKISEIVMDMRNNFWYFGDKPSFRIPFSKDVPLPVDDSPVETNSSSCPSNSIPSEVPLHSNTVDETETNYLHLREEGQALNVEEMVLLNETSESISSSDKECLQNNQPECDEKDESKRQDICAGNSSKGAFFDRQRRNAYRSDTHFQDGRRDSFKRGRQNREVIVIKIMRDSIHHLIEKTIITIRKVNLFRKTIPEGTITEDHAGVLIGIHVKKICIILMIKEFIIGETGYTLCYPTDLPLPL